MISKISQISFIIFFSFLYNITNEGMEYTLSIDKTEIKNDDIIINLTTNINIDKGYYTYSSDSTLSLNNTRFEWEDSSVFENLGQMIEPSPKIKYDKWC